MTETGWQLQEAGARLIERVKSVRYKGVQAAHAP